MLEILAYLPFSDICTYPIKHFQITKLMNSIMDSNPEENQLDRGSLHLSEKAHTS